MSINKFKNSWPVSRMGIGSLTIVNSWRGAYTLFKKETLRFWRVAFQTIASPVLTAGSGDGPRQSRNR